MRLTFLGGTGTVTGSKYLLEHEGRRMLVDAGLLAFAFGCAAPATCSARPARGSNGRADRSCSRVTSAARIVNSVEESKRLNDMRYPAVIISASGMASGGRVLHHLKAFAPDPRNSIVFAGFQAAGTRGAAMVGGARSVKIHGQQVPIRAEVAQLDSLSAHADRDELLAWIGALPSAPRRVFVTHGEPVAADALRQAIEERHHWPCSVPEYRDTVEL